MFGSISSKAVAIVVAVVMGLGGVAAASTGVLDSAEEPELEAPTTTEIESTTSTTEAPDETVPEPEESPTTTASDPADDNADDDGEADDPGEVHEDEDGEADDERRPEAPSCEDAENHGHYVSGVAHSGGDVAEAAQSDCGKPDRPAHPHGDEADDDGDEADDDGDDDDDDDGDDDGDDDDDDDDDRPGRGGDKGNGNGHGRR